MPNDQMKIEIINTPLYALGSNEAGIKEFPIVIGPEREKISKLVYTSPDGSPMFFDGYYLFRIVQESDGTYTKDSRYTYNSYNQVWKLDTQFVKDTTADKIDKPRLLTKEEKIQLQLSFTKLTEEPNSRKVIEKEASAAFYSFEAERKKETILKLLKEFHAHVVNNSIEVGASSSLAAHIDRQYALYLDALFQEKIWAEENQDAISFLNKVYEFFEWHWDSVKGTILSYTALPRSFSTSYLCKIAQAASHLDKDDTEKNKPAISILMPTVIIESMKSDFPNLDDLPIQDVLDTHILNDACNELLPVRLFKDLKQPIDFEYQKLKPQTPYGGSVLSPSELKRFESHSPELSALFECIREYNEIQKEQGTLLSHVVALAHGLKANSAHGGIGLSDKAGEGTYAVIQKFLKFYSGLSTEQCSKIPESIKKIVSKLIDYAGDVGQKPYQFISVNNNSQIESRIEEGVIYVNAKNNTCTLIEYKNHKQITIEIGKSNIDLSNLSKENKDKILHFLCEHQCIPESLKVFVSKIGVIDSCTGTRSEELEKVLRDVAVVNALSKIMLSKDLQETRIRQLQAEFTSHIKALNRCVGADKPSPTWEILNKIGLNPSLLISDIEQLNQFIIQTLPEDIEYFFQDEKMQDQFLQSVVCLDNFALLLVQHLPEKITALFHALSAKVGKLIRNPDDLIKLFALLNQEKQQAILNGFTVPMLSALGIMNTSHVRSKILKSPRLNIPDQVYENLWSALEDKFLPKPISQEDFIKAIKGGAPFTQYDAKSIIDIGNQETLIKICNALKDKISKGNVLSFVTWISTEFDQTVKTLDLYKRMFSDFPIEFHRHMLAKQLCFIDNLENALKFIDLIKEKPGYEEDLFRTCCYKFIHNPADAIKLTPSKLIGYLRSLSFSEMTKRFTLSDWKAWLNMNTTQLEVRSLVLDQFFLQLPALITPENSVALKEIRASLLSDQKNRFDDALFEGWTLVNFQPKLQAVFDFYSNEKDRNTILLKRLSKDFDKQNMLSERVNRFKGLYDMLTGRTNEYVSFLFEWLKLTPQFAGFVLNQDEKNALNAQFQLSPSLLNSLDKEVGEGGRKEVEFHAIKVWTSTESVNMPEKVSAVGRYLAICREQKSTAGLKKLIQVCRDCNLSLSQKIADFSLAFTCNFDTDIFIDLITDQDITDEECQILCGDYLKTPLLHSMSEVGFNKEFTRKWTVFFEKTRKNKGFCEQRLCMVINLIQEDIYKAIRYPGQTAWQNLRLLFDICPASACSVITAALGKDPKKLATLITKENFAGLGYAWDYWSSKDKLYMTDDRYRDICKSVLPHLIGTLVKDVYELYEWMKEVERKNLTQYNSRFFILSDLVATHAMALVHNPDEFFRLLWALHPSVHVVVVSEALKQCLAQNPIYTDPKIWEGLFNVLNNKHLHLIFQALDSIKTHFPDRSQDMMRDIFKKMHNLPSEKSKCFYNWAKKDLSKLIQTMPDLLSILFFLDREDRTDFFQRIEPQKLGELIHTQNDYRRLLDYINRLDLTDKNRVIALLENQSQKFDVFNQFKTAKDYFDNLSRRAQTDTTTVEEFRTACLHFISGSERTALFQYVKTAYSVERQEFFNHLSLEKFEVFCEVLRDSSSKDKLDEIKSNFTDPYLGLPLAYYISACNILGYELTPTDLSERLSAAGESLDAVCKHINFSFIQTMADLVPWITKLNDEQLKKILPYLKPYASRVITSLADFEAFIELCIKDAPNITGAKILHISNLSPDDEKLDYMAKAILCLYRKRHDFRLKDSMIEEIKKLLSSSTGRIGYFVANLGEARKLLPSSLSAFSQLYCGHGCIENCYDNPRTLVAMFNQLGNPAQYDADAAAFLVKRAGIPLNYWIYAINRLDNEMIQAIVTQSALEIFNVNFSHLSQVILSITDNRGRAVFDALIKMDEFNPGADIFAYEGIAAKLLAGARNSEDIHKLLDLYIKPHFLTQIKTLTDALTIFRGVSLKDQGYITTQCRGLIFQSSIGAAPIHRYGVNSISELIGILYKIHSLSDIRMLCQFIDFNELLSDDDAIETLFTLIRYQSRIRKDEGACLTIIYEAIANQLYRDDPNKMLAIIRVMKDTMIGDECCYTIKRNHLNIYEFLRVFRKFTPEQAIQAYLAIRTRYPKEYGASTPQAISLSFSSFYPDVEAFKTFCNGIKTEILSSVEKNEAFDCFREAQEYRTILYSMLKETLFENVSTFDQFIDKLGIGDRYVRRDGDSIIMRELGIHYADKLVPLIKSPDHFNKLFGDYNWEATAIQESYGTSLRSILDAPIDFYKFFRSHLSIKSPDEFRKNYDLYKILMGETWIKNHAFELLKWVNKETDSKYAASLQPILVKELEHIYRNNLGDFGKSLNTLRPEEAEVALKQCKYFFSEATSEDIQALLANLDETHVPIVCNILKDKLLALLQAESSQIYFIDKETLPLDDTERNNFMNSAIVKCENPKKRISYSKTPFVDNLPSETLKKAVISVTKDFLFSNIDEHCSKAVIDLCSLDDYALMIKTTSTFTTLQKLLLTDNRFSLEDYKSFLGVIKNKQAALPLMTYLSWCPKENRSLFIQKLSALSDAPTFFNKAMQSWQIPYRSTPTDREIIKKRLFSDIHSLVQHHPNSEELIGLLFSFLKETQDFFGGCSSHISKLLFLSNDEEYLTLLEGSKNIWMHRDGAFAELIRSINSASNEDLTPMVRFFHFIRHMSTKDNECIEEYINSLMKNKVPPFHNPAGKQISDTFKKTAVSQGQVKAYKDARLEKARINAQNENDKALMLSKKIALEDLKRTGIRTYEDFFRIVSKNPELNEIFSAFLKDDSLCKELQSSCSTTEHFAHIMLSYPTTSDRPFYAMTLKLAQAKGVQGPALISCMLKMSPSVKSLNKLISRIYVSIRSFEQYLFPFTKDLEQIVQAFYDAYADNKTINSGEQQIFSKVTYILFDVIEESRFKPEELSALNNLQYNWVIFCKNKGIEFTRVQSPNLSYKMEAIKEKLSREPVPTNPLTSPVQSLPQVPESPEVSGGTPEKLPATAAASIDQTRSHEQQARAKDVHKKIALPNEPTAGSNTLIETPIQNPSPLPQGTEVSGSTPEKLPATSTESTGKTLSDEEQAAHHTKDINEKNLELKKDQDLQVSTQEQPINADIIKLRQELERVKTEKDRLFTLLDGTKTENETLKMHLSEIKSDHAQQIATSAAKIENADAMLRKKDQLIRSTIAEHEVSIQQLSTLEAENKALRSNFSNLEQAHADLQAKLKQVETEVEQTSTLNEKLQSTKAELIENAETMLRKKDQLIRSKIAEHELSIQQLSTLEAENKALRSNFSNLEQAHADLQAKLKQVETEVEQTSTLNEKLQSTKAELSVERNRNEQLASAHNALEQEMGRIRRHYERMEADNLLQMEQREVFVESHKDEVIALKINLESNAVKIESMMAEIRSLRQDITRRDGLNLSLKEELDSKSSELDRYKNNAQFDRKESGELVNLDPTSGFDSRTENPSDSSENIPPSNDDNKFIKEKQKLFASLKSYSEKPRRFIQSSRQLNGEINRKLAFELSEELDLAQTRDVAAKLFTPKAIEKRRKDIINRDAYDRKKGYVQREINSTTLNKIIKLANTYFSDEFVFNTNRLKHDLEAYIRRVNKVTSYEAGFILFKESRGRSRKVNCHLAEELLVRLNSVKTPSDVATLFLEENINKMMSLLKAERGMNSAELKAVFALARELFPKEIASKSEDPSSSNPSSKP